MKNYEDKDAQAIMNYDESREYDTMELSLSSGLECLKTFKNLETIGIQVHPSYCTTGARLDGSELAQFQVMHGVNSDEMYAVAHGVERAELREYFQELRPDVVYDSFEETMGQCSPY
ncbi:hypothetical protein MVEG_10755 [Podila verticillata NRRL 6337]|nr:hypothetical protein MVEG_10755 [Podila verticillata NRRL 6337]